MTQSILVLLMFVGFAVTTCLVGQTWICHRNNSQISLLYVLKFILSLRSLNIYFFISALYLELDEIPGDFFGS